MSFLNQLVHVFPESLDHIVYVGAGAGFELDILQAKGFNHLTLVEANADLCDGLTEHIENSQIGNVSVVCRALSSITGKQVLNVANNVDFSSLAEPNEITTYYPNVRINKQVSVKSTTLEILNDELDIDRLKYNLLVLDIQGLEGLVLANSNVEELNKYSCIIIRTSEQALYAVEPNGYQESCAFFSEHNIDYIVLPDPAPPFVNLVVSRRPNWQDLQMINSELDLKYLKISKRIVTIETQLQDAQSANELLENKHSKEKENSIRLLAKIENLEEQNTALQSGYDATLDTAKNNETSIKAISAERDQVTLELKASKASLDSMMKELESLKEKHLELNGNQEELQAQLQQSESEKEKQSQQGKEQSVKLTKLQQQVATAEEQLQAQQAKTTSLETQKLQLQKDMEKVKKDRQELDYRQHLLDEELVKAEAQLELIKDVVLRDKAF